MVGGYHTASHQRVQRGHPKIGGALWQNRALSLYHWVSRSRPNLHSSLMPPLSSSLFAAGVPDRASPDAVWRLVHRDREFSGYAITALSPDHRWLALGSLQGWVALFQLENCDHSGLVATHHHLQWRAHRGKVFSLTWLGSLRGCPHLLTCGPGGETVRQRLSLRV